MNDCDVDKKGLGLSQCNKLPALIRSMITTPASFYFTAAQVESATLMEAALQAAILNPEASRVHVWPNFVSFENLSEEAVYEDTPLAYLAVRDGNYRFRFGIKESLCLHTAMYTHRATSGRVFLFDVENQLIGTSDAAGNFYGLTIQMLNSEKLIISDGSVSTKSPILVALSNNKELDADGSIISAPFVNTVNRLTDILLTVVSASDTEIVVRAAVECDNTALNGLVTADFILLDADGASQTISGSSEADGVYTLTGSSWTSGTLKLAAPADLSVQAYESNIATVTIAT